jgi:hypothetical protein
MSAETLATVILAIVAGLGLFGGGIAWFYKRGGQERESAIALRDNTKATVDLTERMDLFMQRTENKLDEQDRRGNNHETRLTVIERDVRQLNKAVNFDGRS